MVEGQLFIPILLGTLHEGRQSEKVAKLVHEIVSKRSDIETHLFDVRDMNFPLNDEGQNLKELNPEWRDAIIRADGLIIVSPEYNHGYPGSLKMALDMLLKEYIHKAVGICAVSAQAFGGPRVVEKLVQVVRELGLVVTFTDLYFTRVKEAFDDAGKIKDEKTYERIDGFLEELEWMAKALKYARAQLPSKYHDQK
jgi:NAD(P)H-dependent FMN reductase